MVDSLQGSKAEVSEFDDVEILGRTAFASFKVTHLDADKGGYDYITILVKEGDEWLWEESCLASDNSAR